MLKCSTRIFQLIDSTFNLFKYLDYQRFIFGQYFSMLKLYFNKLKCSKLMGYTL